MQFILSRQEENSLKNTSVYQHIVDVLFEEKTQLSLLYFYYSYYTQIVKNRINLKERTLFQTVSVLCSFLRVCFQNLKSRKKIRTSKRDLIVRMIMVFLSVGFIIPLCTTQSKVQLADYIPSQNLSLLFFV